MTKVLIQIDELLKLKRIGAFSLQLAALLVVSFLSAWLINWELKEILPYTSALFFTSLLFQGVVMVMKNRQERVSELEKKGNELDSALNSAIEKAEALAERKRIISVQLDARNEEVDILKKRLASLQTALDDERHARTKIEQLNKTLAQRSSDLETSVEALEKSHDTLNRRLTEAGTDNDQLAKDIKDLEYTLKVERLNSEEIKEKYTIVRENLDRAKKRMSAKKIENKDLVLA
ncbi:hypothetical protein V6R21_20035 [Limibacter armeniacum]|uniref:coiled-coil domain-containing protein n=1 Tax=Limibacter armeniacum TaxID=466084 RepID=UPI002FE51D6C